MSFPNEYTLPKNQDARLRNMARRHGYAIRKSRQGLGGADNFGGYMIADPDTGGLVAGGRFDLTGADVAAWLSS